MRFSGRPRGSNRGEACCAILFKNSCLYKSIYSNRHYHYASICFCFFSYCLGICLQNCIIIEWSSQQILCRPRMTQKQISNVYREFYLFTWLCYTGRYCLLQPGEWDAIFAMDFNQKYQINSTIKSFKWQFLKWNENKMVFLASHSHVAQTRNRCRKSFAQNLCIHILLFHAAYIPVQFIVVR